MGLNQGELVLDPFAGRGALIAALARRWPGRYVGAGPVGYDLVEEGKGSEGLGEAIIKTSILPSCSIQLTHGPESASD